MPGLLSYLKKNRREEGWKWKTQIEGEDFKMKKMKEKENNLRMQRGEKL